MRNAILFVFTIISISIYSQSSVFEITNQVVTLNGKANANYNSTPLLKVNSLDNGKYDVGIKDDLEDYFIFVTVKYSHIENGIYIYTVVAYDSEFRNVKYIGTDEKLSKMANGIKGDIIFYLNSENNLFFSTK